MLILYLTTDNMPQITTQKATDYRLKDNLLPHKRQPFTPPFEMKA